MSTTSNSKSQIGAYLGFVFLFSSLFYVLILRGHRLGGGGGLYVTGLMWCPALAAMLTLKLNGRKLSELGWRWPERKYATMSWYVPLIYALVAYAIVWALGFGGVPNPEFIQSAQERMGQHASPAVSTMLYILLVGSFGMVGSLAHALGEEIGWRGFLVPELSKNVGFTGTALISGAVWAMWHYPVLIWGDYNAGTPTWYGLTCFTVMVFAASFFFAWLRLKSGSLWTGALLHASHNLYVQAIFTPLTRDTGKTAWYIDEFGCVLPLVTVLVAIYFWMRRKELASTSGTETLEPALASN